MVRNRSTNKAKPAMSLVHPNAAAIDIGATMHMAAVSADRTPEPVHSWGTFTADLHRLVDWFTECGVETVVMEGSNLRTSRHQGFCGFRRQRTRCQTRAWTQDRRQ